MALIVKTCEQGIVLVQRPGHQTESLEAHSPTYSACDVVRYGHLDETCDELTHPEIQLTSSPTNALT